MRRKLIDLKQQRTALLEKAEALLKEGKREEYQTEMVKVQNLNSEIADTQKLLDEMDRQFMEKAPDLREERDKAAERGELLKKKQAVTLDNLEVRRFFYGAREKSVTLATGSLALPSGTGSEIRDPIGNVVSSIVDQVYVQDLTGMESYSEPYVISETDAQTGKVSTNAGKKRPDSSDPTFGVAQIKAYEMSTSNFVDKNISRLTPANYYAKILAMAMRAMRRETAKLIVNGDGTASPDMYGIKTAKNKAGGLIYAQVDISAIDENLLDTLLFSYGSDEAIGTNARLYLTKADLRAIGQLRNGDKERVFRIRPDGGNPNTGMIEDGGVMTPYTIVGALTSLADAVQGASAIQTMLYGDPMNYELALFGGYTIRVDDSIKGLERMTTILGDAMIGGNLIVDKGFVVATLPAKSS